ncbi:type VII secretion-associated protein [Corynebacterium pseudodiphtheriticum]|uniref:type VII secretion-associated protein n=1 Tax=Corynebacterium pseudodiphtheriticum TaxID=37637 RepID=UPI002543FAE5|nr:type VII secretion-associated protein [Corynebacterium pseudodiphtheriticum]MDK4240736.1 type VII secretion-associated protein [Corynebacterium pseudodiphtheriticum]
MIRADYETESQPQHSGVQVSVFFYDDATVFGVVGTDETIVRYDLPARGITEGWTVSAVLEQTEAMAEEEWPQIDVEIFADDAEVYDDFARVLTQHGVRVLADDVGAVVAEPDNASNATDAAHSVPMRSDEDAFAAARAGVSQRATENQSVGSNFVQLIARKPKRRRHAKAGWRPSPFQILVAAGIAVTGLSGWWVLDRYGGAGGVDEVNAVITADSAGGAGSTETTAAEPADAELTDAETADAESADVGEIVASPHSADKPQMVHEHSGLRLVTPRGFVIGDSSQPGVFAATGEDPNLRIYVTTDQLHDDAAAQINHDAVLTDIMQTVASSPDLQEGRREHEPREQVRYVENPGDGSRIAWTSWVEENQQLSVGCHSRHTATAEQKQACELVVGSLERI